MQFIFWGQHLYSDPKQLLHNMSNVQITNINMLSRKPEYSYFSALIN